MDQGPKTKDQGPFGAPVRTIRACNGLRSLVYGLWSDPALRIPHAAFLRWIRLLLLISLPLLIGRPVRVYAEVPQLIAYQGRLTEDDGQPLVGAHQVKFRLYDQERGGSRLWEEAHALSFDARDNGVFSVVLGSLTPFKTVTFTRQLWLALEVDHDGEMSPRLRLTAAGYALNADTIDGIHSEQLLRSDVDTVAKGQLILTKPGTALLIHPSVIVGADSKLIDVQHPAGNSRFSVDSEGDVVIGGNLTVRGATTLTGLSASQLSLGTLPEARLPSSVSLLGQTIESAEITDGTITAADLAPDSVGAAALRSDAIQAGDIEAGDLPAHASRHQPGGPDALPTAEAISVGTVNGAGTSTSFARADHQHQGIHSLRVDQQAALFGDVTLQAGDHVSLSQRGQTITIQAEAGGGQNGARISQSASNPVVIGTSGVELLSATITKTRATSGLWITATVELVHERGSNRAVELTLFRDAAQVEPTTTAQIGPGAGFSRELPVTVQAWDASPAGTYTITLKAKASHDGASATVRRLTVVELL